jgi:hypothetical protein
MYFLYDEDDIRYSDSDSDSDSGSGSEYEYEFKVSDSCVKTVTGAGTPFIICLIAHDLNTTITNTEDSKVMNERFIYRIYAEDIDSAEDIFMQQPELQKYMAEQDIECASIYDIDQWDALCIYMATDPKPSDTSMP